MIGRTVFTGTTSFKKFDYVLPIYNVLNLRKLFCTKHSLCFPFAKQKNSVFLFPRLKKNLIEIKFDDEISIL